MYWYDDTEGKYPIGPYSYMESIYPEEQAEARECELHVYYSKLVMPFFWN